MFVVHGTRKFLDRLKEPTDAPIEVPTTVLGNWYATALFWKQQVALFTNELTLVPVLVPLAPAATVIDRFSAMLETVLRAHGLSDSFVEHELAEMTAHRVAKTENRSVVGIMNEFARLGAYDHPVNGVPDLLGLSLRLAEIPCGPLYSRHVSPDRELAAFVAARSDDDDDDARRTVGP